jgi:hypothetical protein
VSVKALLRKDRQAKTNLETYTFFKGSEKMAQMCGSILCPLIPSLENIKRDFAGKLGNLNRG